MSVIANPPVAVPNVNGYATAHTLFGERFVIDSTPGSVPMGDVVWVKAAQGQPFSGAWLIHPESWAELNRKSNGMKHSLVQIIASARKEGRTVVAGVVVHNGKKPAPAQKKRHANLDEMSDRAKGLIVQIGTLLDAGPIPDGTMAEISQTYAALQTEYERLMEQMGEIETHLSMARGLVIEYATS